jgi:hypothetical protein
VGTMALLYFESLKGFLPDTFEEMYWCSEGFSKSVYAQGFTVFVCSSTLWMFMPLTCTIMYSCFFLLLLLLLYPADLVYRVEYRNSNTLPLCLWLLVVYKAVKDW